jgi:hypothetical protein
MRRAGARAPMMAGPRTTLDVILASGWTIAAPWIFESASDERW